MFDDYNYTIEDAQHVAISFDQLQEAAEIAEADDIIFVPPHVDIEATGRVNLGASTLASRGATLRRSENFDGTFLKVRDGTLAGIELCGPAPGHVEWPGYGNDILSRGAELDGKCLVEHCDIHDWGHAGLCVGRNKDGSVATVRNCKLYDNELQGWGYGIETEAGVRAINCYFNNNRHSLAADGNPEDVWWSVVGCHQGPDAYLHAFDTHRPGINHIKFQSNYSELKRTNTIRVRGEVREGGRIEDNWFREERFVPYDDDDSALRIGPAKAFHEEDVTVRNNLFRDDRPENVLGTPLIDSAAEKAVREEAD